jgi:hypothetical protein
MQSREYMARSRRSTSQELESFDPRSQLDTLVAPRELFDPGGKVLRCVSVHVIRSVTF